MSSARVWKIEDLYLIATLILIDIYDYTKNALSCKDNKKRCLSRTGGIGESPVQSQEMLLKGTSMV